MIPCMKNKVKTVMCTLKHVITSEKGIVRTRNHLDLILFVSNYYCFMEIFQDMEGLVLNCVETPVEI